MNVGEVVANYCRRLATFSIFPSSKEVSMAIDRAYSGQAYRPKGPRSPVFPRKGIANGVYYLVAALPTLSFGGPQEPTNGRADRGERPVGAGDYEKGGRRVWERLTSFKQRGCSKLGSEEIIIQPGPVHPSLYVHLTLRTAQRP